MENTSSLIKSLKLKKNIPTTNSSNKLNMLNNFTSSAKNLQKNPKSKEIIPKNLSFHKENQNFSTINTMLINSTNKFLKTLSKQNSPRRKFEEEEDQAKYLKKHLKNSLSHSHSSINFDKNNRKSIQIDSKESKINNFNYQTTQTNDSNYVKTENYDEIKSKIDKTLNFSIKNNLKNFKNNIELMKTNIFKNFKKKFSPQKAKNEQDSKKNSMRSSTKNNTNPSMNLSKNNSKKNLSLSKAHYIPDKVINIHHNINQNININIHKSRINSISSMNSLSPNETNGSDLTNNNNNPKNFIYNNYFNNNLSSFINLKTQNNNNSVKLKREKQSFNNISFNKLMELKEISNQSKFKVKEKENKKEKFEKDNDESIKENQKLNKSSKAFQINNIRNSHNDIEKLKLLKPFKIVDKKHINNKSQPFLQKVFDTVESGKQLQKSNSNSLISEESLLTFLSNSKNNSKNSHSKKHQSSSLKYSSSSTDFNKLKDLSLSSSNKDKDNKLINKENLLEASISYNLSDDEFRTYQNNNRLQTEETILDNNINIDKSNSGVSNKHNSDLNSPNFEENCDDFQKFYEEMNLKLLNYK